MTTITQSNERILEEHADVLELVRQEIGLEAAVSYANSLINQAEGKVGPDGCYTPRRRADGGELREP